MNRIRNRGLTLVEVIVLAVIVLIAVALVLPMLHTHRTPARRTSCASNLNQLGKAMFMYADDPSNNVFPTTSTDKDDPFACNKSMAAWGLLYNKYVMDPRVFSCPSRPSVPSELHAWKPGQPVPPSCNFVYDPGHSPETVAAIAGDKKGSAQNSDNHGENAGQNVLIGVGTVEFIETVARKVDEKGMLDKDIYSRNLELPREMDGYLRQ